MKFIIVGGTSGLGLELARWLCASGHEPIIMGNEREEVAAVSDELGCQGYLGDVANPNDVRGMIGGAFARHGHIDGLVNCAALWLPAGRLHDLKLEDVARATDVNMRGALLVTHQAVTHLRLQEGGGRLVLIGAMAAIRPAPRVAAYAGHKAGLGHFGTSVSRDYVSDKVRVTVVNLGAMPTRLQERVGEQFLDPEWADPREVADLICRMVLVLQGNLTIERIDLAGSEDQKR